MSFVEQFDQGVDRALERFRGNPVLDAVFLTASELGDFSLVWHLCNTARGVVGGREATDETFLFALLLGGESLLVNQGIKRLFGRQRPTDSGDPRLHVRTPLTSSFPSGHASAAFFAASVLTAMGPRRCAPLWFGIAGVVATSRAYVRIHHASDVVGGAAVGLVLGAVVRKAGIGRLRTAVAPAR
jgi:undecaprenyl-diphosphatase